MSVLLPLLVALAILVAWAAWAIRGDGTPLSVENRSGLALRSVVVSGSGFERALGDIAPGAIVRTSVEPRGESGAALAFTENGRRIASPAAGYFEGGGDYVVRIVVAPDLAASVEGTLRY